jgi:predicted dehydrogenase
MINVAIFGMGRAGQFRAEAIKNSERSVLVAAHDPTHGKVSPDLADTKESILSRKDIDAVVIATPTKYHAELAMEALKKGKHVLCEKPLGLNLSEALDMCACAKENSRMLHVGFNYRHMSHVRAAKARLDRGDIGRPMFVRCRYGHGGHPGYEKDWCTQKEFSGGGVLIEQAIHVLDLVRYLFGEPRKVLARTDCCFHKFSNTEDNAFLLLETQQGMAQIHVSWTQWMSIFELEIFGTDGYLRLEGRDGFYGPQKLTAGHRLPDHSRPTEVTQTFENSLAHWEIDWAAFENEIMGNVLQSNSHDGLQAQRLIEAAYASAAAKVWVEV